MKELFVERKFTPHSLEIIDRVNAVMDEYSALGYDLSLRQLYYQMVARGYLPNTVREYKNLGSIVNDARLAGLVDWGMIKDRGRELVRQPHWADPKEILRLAAEQYAIDKWWGQPNYVLVMVEKDALSGVLEPVCAELDVDFMANKGYSSASAMYEVAKMLHRRGRQEYRDVWVLYLGDHDPSGLDMTRDVEERLQLLSGLTDTDIHVQRLALNMDQVQQLQPPENPAKDTDARYDKYVAQYGDSSWELDAIEPAALADIVREGVLGLRDEELWEQAETLQEQQRSDLWRIAREYRSAP